MDVRRNQDAERALLGAAIGDSLVAARVAGLPEQLFTDRGCRAVHGAMQRMVRTGRKIDLVTLSAEVRREIADPEPMLIAMQSAGFMPSMAGEYIAMLEDAHKRRTLYQAAVSVAAGTGDPGQTVEAMEAELSAAMRPMGTETGTTDMRQALTRLSDSIDSARTNRRQTGIADLDRMIGGLAPGQLVYIGARPGVGKSALGLAIAAHVARKGGRALYVTLEMGAEEMAARILADEGQVNLQQLTTGRLGADEYQRIAPLWGELARLPLWFDEKARTPLQVRRSAVRMQSAGGLTLIAVDYIQLLSGGGKYGSRYEEVTAISRELKLMAMELGVPVVCMCQLNRSSEKGFGRAKRTEPSMAEARDSGAIEQDANLFLTLYQPEEPPEDAEGAELYQTFVQAGLSPMRIKVEKNRQGPTGVVNVGFDKPHMRFLCIRRET